VLAEIKRKQGEVKMSNLRSELVKLASDNPGFRKHLVPILKGEPRSMKRANVMKKEAGGMASALDLVFLIISQESSSKGQKMFMDTKKALESDEQSKKLMSEVLRGVARSLILDQKENTALNYIRMAMKNVRSAGSARNSIFKAAHALGIKLPSSIFASNDSELQEQLQKLANENPEGIRKHLVPLLR